MKRPGDGWTKINWYVCPKCGKKGYYWKYNGTGKDWFCKYCRESGHKPGSLLNLQVAPNPDYKEYQGNYYDDLDDIGGI